MMEILEMIIELARRFGRIFTFGLITDELWLFWIGFLIYVTVVLVAWSMYRQRRD